jgi:hypothetical protein
MQNATSPAPPAAHESGGQAIRSTARQLAIAEEGGPHSGCVWLQPCTCVQPSSLLQRLLTGKTPPLHLLLQENAGNEPAASSGGGGWSSSNADADHAAASGSGAAASSSLVEKASWAGQGGQAPRAPWEQQQARSLNLREFPSLAAAAAVPQQPTAPHRGPAVPEHGAWDEDERGGGSGGPGRMPGPDHGRGRDFGGQSASGSGREGYGGGGEDGTGGYYGRGPAPPPYYGRYRGEVSPSREQRRYEGEEQQYHSRFGPPGSREPHGGYHDRGSSGGGYGGWREEAPPRDWHPGRQDRCDGGRRWVQILQAGQRTCSCAEG